MFKKLTYLSLLVNISLLANSDTDALKVQLKIQETATKQLIKRVNALESSNNKINTSASFSQKAYLPDIAFILNMSAVSRDIKNSDYINYKIPGFINTPDILFNKNRGFNLNYAEVDLHSAVDPYFDAYAVFHLQPDVFEIEEAYVITRSLPFGLRVKAGKFRSSFGRLNEQHQHVWHFDTLALVYESFFGPDSLKDPGVQLQWVAPIDTYVMFGIEAMQGTNTKSFGAVDGNNLYVTYAKSSIDIGDNLSVLGGVSLAHGETILQKNSNVYGVDLTMREQLGSYNSLVWQSEYLYRDMDVDSTVNSKQKQAGLYSELIYQYNNNYSIGARYDLISQNRSDLGAYSGINTDNLHKYTAMVQYKPFPFSRLRVSYSYDRSKIINGARRDINRVMLTLNIAAGAHGAHSY